MSENFSLDIDFKLLNIIILLNYNIKLLLKFIITGNEWNKGMENKRNRGIKVESEKRKKYPKCILCYKDDITYYLETNNNLFNIE